MTNNNGLSRLNKAPLLTPRSWLFVPAMRSDRFIKAMNSGADAVIIDLEDAVDATHKQQARQNVASFVLDQQQKPDERSFLPHLWLRINNPDQDEVSWQSDMQLCHQLIDSNNDSEQSNSSKLAGIILPKVSSSAQVRQVTQQLQTPVIAQIESALGISNLTDITQVSGLQAISYGRLDIANELNLRTGSQAEADFFGQLRMQMLIASKAHHLMAPIESIYANFKDTEAMTSVAGYASDLGFSGMLCIHPSQVAVVNQAFNVTEQQLQFAKQVIDHYKQTGDSIFAIDGVMVDLPVILQCQRLLESNS
ncbi:HpcH/HpaI aldolase/citrate lyase family protein [Psychrobacter sp. FDAARGOS_221]|uniref:HpcH/HpaI aldolase/citrate lyase family protein n=1 Tax=Psychrobacter sp. FDAARGOS_221 TaxID=1975705 RepID=UPI001D0D7E09|nr:CoA ester lyase [Psychrobacter sp. FDAARGOS_221]